MQAAGWQARALATALFVVAASPLDAQTVVATVPAPGHELRGQGESLEEKGDLLGAAMLFEAALGSAPDDGQLHWRIARDLLRHAERNPALDSDEHSGLYERARDWAHAGRALDASCAECCLYEFAATASLARLHGLVRAAGTVREAGVLLEQCLANPPRWRDASGSEEASLYYGASVFYRRMPDSEWIAWATGQRSDATRAVSLARRAVEIESDRVRYRVELGAALLCDGTRREDAAALREARRWLADAAQGTSRDAQHARTLVGDAPDRACELSLDEPEEPR